MNWMHVTPKLDRLDLEKFDQKVRLISGFGRVYDEF